MEDIQGIVAIIALIVGFGKFIFPTLNENLHNILVLTVSLLLFIFMPNSILGIVWLVLGILGCILVYITEKDDDV